MADELEPVTQEFLADTSEYESALDEASATAQEFADANVEAKAAVDEVRDSAVEAAPAVGHMRDEIAEAAAALGLYQDKLGRWHEASGQFAAAAEVEARGLAHLRDAAAEAAAAMGLVKDAEGRWVDDAGEVVAASEVEGAALGHIRDEALEAAAAVRELKKEDDSVARDGLLAKLFSQGGGIPDSIGPLPLASLLAIVPAILAALPLLTGVVSGFAAAGAGAVAFAALAYPAIKQVTGALGDSKSQLEKQPKMVQEAVGAIKGLEGEYKNLSKAFQPQAFQIFNDVLKIANELLPDITPFAQIFASSVGGLLQHLGSFAGSSGFKDWLKQFQGLEGPSVTAIGNGIGHVAVQIGHLLTVMSSKDVVNAINIAFGILAGTISVVTGMVWRLMSNWDILSSAFRRVRHDVAADAHELAHVFDDLRHDIANDAHNMASYFDELRHDIATGAHDIANWFDQDRHAVANLAHDFASYFDEARANVHNWADDMGRDAQDVVAFFRRLPGEILSALGNLGNLLWNEGADILRGLLNGIKSAAAPVLSFIGGIGHDISSVFSSALSILSPSRVFYQHGVNTLQGYIDGVKATAPQLLAAMRGIGGRVATGGLPGVTTGAALGAGASGSAPSVHLTMPVTLQGAAQAYNTPAFYQYLQAQIQEAILRYGLNNPGTGLALATGRR